MNFTFFKSRLFIVIFSLLTVSAFFMLQHNAVFLQQQKNEASTEENEEYDGPDKAVLQRQFQTRDLSTGKVPVEGLWKAVMATENLRQNAPFRTNALSWIERGPNTDAPGPQGNSRPNGDVTGGRMRTVMVDSLDPAKKTVWAGSVAGGLWKTTDITVSPANWVPINDQFSNLSIADICQDPSNPNTMYFATGESYFNSDAVQGAGVFKSTNHGVTWTQLPSTVSYVSNTRILCDFQGNIYLATRDNGLLRSTNGGTTWVTITPAGVGTSRICDLEISSTSSSSPRLHCVLGIFSTQAYRFTDIPVTATTADWIAPTTAFPSFANRAEIALSKNGNTLYALPANASHQVPTIYKSTDGGQNWAATGGQPTTGWASGQGWYALSAAVNPVNEDEVIIGGLDCFKTNNGGLTWSKISTWVGNTGQYVHADQHDLAWYDGGNKLIFACDGGVHYSNDKGVTIRDRNIGLRVKQFYSVAMHPTTPDFFLAGAQDNGTHRLTNPGLGGSIEVTGGDGAYVAIDQDQPQYQFGAYVYSQYRRSTDGGNTWSSINFSGSNGQFINPFDYDDLGNKIYACYTNGTYLRWDNPQTGNTTVTINIPSFNNVQVGAVHVSPYTANQVYFGTSGGRVVKVTNADGAAPTDVNLTQAGMPAGYINCVSTGSSDQFLVATYANYGVTNIWVSTNGGTSWIGIDGNLPNLPVNWALFHPDDNNKMIIATETGVWETDLINGASTVWVPNTSFPNVRTDMLQYRPGDRTIAAGTHGRGVWSAIIPSSCQAATINAQPSNSSACTGSNVSFTVGVGAGVFSYQWQISTTGIGGTYSNITNGGIYSGATTATLNLTGVGLAQTNSFYKCIITTTCTPIQTTTSNSVSLTVANGISITGQPANAVVCAGVNTSFSVTTSGVPTSYQWQVSVGGGAYTNLSNTAPYSGVNTATLSITNPAASLSTNRYQCVLTSTCGNLVSNAGLLTVNATLSAPTDPLSQIICLGNPVTFSTTATGVSLGYQWQSSPDGITYTNIGTATNPSYTFTPVAGDNGKRFKCIVTALCGGPTSTAAALLTVNAALVINSNPSAVTICEDGNTSFTVGVTGVVNSYQWQVSTGGGPFVNLSNTGIYTGATTATLNLTNVPFSNNGNQYRCVVSGSCPAINSTAATLNIQTKPVITQQPVASVNICETQNTGFTIAATGTGIGYQWQVSINNGGSFSNLTNSGNYAGVTTNALTITNASTTMHTYQYRCVVTGTCSPAANSNAAVLNVFTPVSVTTQPANVTICATGTVNFAITAAGTLPTYQWQVSTNNGLSFTDISGAATPGLQLTNITLAMHNNQYRCRVIGAAPCGFVNSNAAVLTVSAQPTISLVAAPFQNVYPGLTTFLTATTSLNPANVTYSWFRNNTAFTNNTNSYAVTVNNTGIYKVTVVDNTNGCTNTSGVVIVADSTINKMFIYPSPNNGQFTVSYFNNLGNTSQTIAIFNVRGDRVFSKKLSVAQGYQLHQMDLRRNKSGIYYVVIGDANGKILAHGEVLVSK